MPTSEEQGDGKKKKNREEKVVEQMKIYQYG
jgi:hypothetical protein